MPRRRILLTWIGLADLKSIPNESLDQTGATLDHSAQNPRNPQNQIGPIKCLVEQEPFDEIHLISDHDISKERAYVKWLGLKPTIHRVKLQNPSNYAEVFRTVDRILGEVVGSPRHPGIDLCIHLSPGTPTMTAVWLLLGKSKFQPATFFQTHNGKAWIEDVPFDLVVDFVPQVLRDADLRLQALASQNPQEVRGFESIAGDSNAIRLAVGRSRRAAHRDVAVLILGESGTGKEMFAKAIHDASPRRDGPFVAINCAALSRELLESELFGHRRGAFTGAVDNRDGAFKLADGGTLFLDEVGECDPTMQAKLLRVLEPADAMPCRREFYRVGESKPTISNVRVIAATNRDLLAAPRSEFRDDLYYRLAVITIKLPPLRGRREDIPLLVASLMDRINRDIGLQEPGYRHKSVSASATDFVKRYHWPGNIRQLYNTLMQAAVMTDGDVIERADIADAVADAPSGPGADLLELPLGEGFSLENLLKDIQKHYLARAMKEGRGVKAKAAKLLGYKGYQTLAAQLERLGVETTDL